VQAHELTARSAAAVAPAQPGGLSDAQIESALKAFDLDSVRATWPRRRGRPRSCEADSATLHRHDARAALRPLHRHDARAAVRAWRGGADALR
jgi:hypothetical protein